jgi:hypothetical protein
VSTQPTLFPDSEPRRPERVQTPGFTGGTCWTHRSGWVVHHCGRPTALCSWCGLPSGAKERDKNQFLLTGRFGLGLGVPPGL